MPDVPAIEYEVDGLFRLTVPGSWRRQDEEGVLLYLDSPDASCSGIFVGGWRPVVTVEPGTFLMDATKSFINHGIIEGEARDVESAETITFVNGETHTARTIVEVDSDEIWLIDMVWDASSGNLFLLHSHGSRDIILRVVATCFDTFSCSDGSRLKAEGNREQGTGDREQKSRRPQAELPTGTGTGHWHWPKIKLPASFTSLAPVKNVCGFFVGIFSPQSRGGRGVSHRQFCGR